MILPRPVALSRSSAGSASSIAFASPGVPKRRMSSTSCRLGARSGAAVVASAGLQPFGMEFPYRGMIRRAERDMGAGA